MSIVELDHHIEHEDHPWTIAIPDHPGRAESAGFRSAKTLAHAIAKTIDGPPFYGDDHVQMHHGGSWYLFDDDGWFMVKAPAGIEWSAQFCADPSKVDRLRVDARRLYAAFPQTVPQMHAMGYPHAADLLDTPIRDAAGIAGWVDSIFNSCVPIPAARHTGVLPGGGGVHHYPTPITDIDLVRHDDYVLWVCDAETDTPAAVVPTAARGSGVGAVEVVYAHPGTPLRRRLDHAHANGESVVLPDDHPLAEQAFTRQR